MTGVWENVDHPLTRDDPFEHWLGEIGGQDPDPSPDPDHAAWVPYILQLEWKDGHGTTKEEVAIALVVALSMPLEGTQQPSTEPGGPNTEQQNLPEPPLIVHRHDAFHAGYNLYRYGRAELIIFVRRGQDAEPIALFSGLVPDTPELLIEMGSRGAAISDRFIKRSGRSFIRTILHSWLL